MRKVGGFGGLVGLIPWKIKMKPKQRGLEDDFAFPLEFELFCLNIFMHIHTKHVCA